MLYALGPLTFTVAPFNADEVDRTSSADFAEKQLLGQRKGHEFVGEGEEKIVLRGSLFPETLGGLDGLAVLDALRSSGTPQMLLRGDGVDLGWFLIERVHGNNKHLNREGVGKKIDFTIELVRDDPPSAADYLATLFSILGG